MSFEGTHRTPGITSDTTLAEWMGWWGREELHGLVANKRISCASRDAGNTTTTLLRGGLVLGEITATKLLKEWNPAGTDGSQIPTCILTRDLYTQELGADAASFVARIQQYGNLKASEVLLPGEAAYGLAGKDNEFLFRNAVARQFLFDDGINPLNQRQVTAIVDTTFTTAFHNAYINNLGAVASRTFTFPAPKPGLTFYVQNLAGQQITIQGSATNEFLPVGGTPADSSVITNTVYALYKIQGISTTLYHVSRMTV